MSKSFVDNLDLGFVKQNPWIVRDKLIRQELNGIEKQIDQKVITGQNIEKLEYGPGYVKKVKERFLALSSNMGFTFGSLNSTPSRKRPGTLNSTLPTLNRPAGTDTWNKAGDAKQDGVGREQETRPLSSSLPIQRSQAESGRANGARRESRDKQEGSGIAEARKTDERLNDRPVHDSVSISALVLEQVEKIGQELSRKTSIGNGQNVIDEDIFGPTTVKSLKERFEKGKIRKGYQMSSSTSSNQSSSQRPDPKKEVKWEFPCLILSIENCGLDDGRPIEFPVAEGMSHPPPTPFPITSEVLDFEGIHSFDASSADGTNRSSESEASIRHEGSQKFDWNFDFETTIRPRSLKTAAAVQPSDYLEAPRKLAQRNDTGDYSGLLQMQSILLRFQQKQAKSPVLEDTLQKTDPQPEILPSDPTPPVIVGHSGENISSSDESTDHLSTDGGQEVGHASIATERPRKERKISIEVIGGGLVPRKTSLAQGPKFERRGLEFSEQPPKAYAYLEESHASLTTEWIPGQELTLDQYRQIRDEAKLERYKKFFASAAYYPSYEEEFAPAPPPVEYDSYYTLATNDASSVIKVHMPTLPTRPPPPLPPVSAIDPDWFIPPPPPYSYAVSAQIAMAQSAMPQ